MNFISRQLQSDEQKIQDIITAFEIYALGDIEHNIKTNKPVAAFILSSCWIDQVALFVYNHNEENLDQHYKNFIKKYLPKYKELDLYSNLRCKLVHSYSIGSNTRISIDDNIFNSQNMGTSLNAITATGLLKDLRTSWEIVKKELLTIGHKTRLNALSRFDKSPTLIEASSNVHYYTKEEADFLISKYLPLLKGKFLNGKSSLPITTIKPHPYKEIESTFVLLVIVKKSNSYVLCEYLERVTQQFGLQFPEDALLQEK